MKEHQRTHKQIELDAVKYMDELIKFGPPKKAREKFNRPAYYQTCKEGASEDKKRTAEDDKA